jgi:hypothetical protein
LELADRHIFNYEEKMLTTTLLEAAAQNTFPDFARKDSLQFALRTSYSFDLDNATANYLISLAGAMELFPFTGQSKTTTESLLIFNTTFNNLESEVLSQNFLRVNMYDK